MKALKEALMKRRMRSSEPIEDHMDEDQQLADLAQGDKAAKMEEVSGLAPEIEEDPSIEGDDDMMEMAEESYQEEGGDQGDAITDEEMMAKLYDPDDLRSRGFMGKAALRMKQKLGR